MNGLIIGNSIEKYGDVWLNRILMGDKTGEIRGTNTKIRGTVVLIESGTNLMLGTIDIVDSLLIPSEGYWNRMYHKHRVNSSFTDLPYNNVWMWCLVNPKPFVTPLKCHTRKPGQVIWVKEAISSTELSYCTSKKNVF